MIVEIFIAQGQAIKALAQQAGQIVRAAGTTARIVQRFGHCRAQSKLTIGLAEQQHAAVAGDIAAIELRLDPAAFTGCKTTRLLGTFCHGQSLVRFQLKQLNLIELQGLCPSYWCIFQANRLRPPANANLPEMLPSTHRNGSRR
jgi:hypothetical protein